SRFFLYAAPHVREAASGSPRNRVGMHPPGGSRILHPECSRLMSAPPAVLKWTVHDVAQWMARASVVIDVLYPGAMTGEIVEDSALRSHRTLERNPFQAGLRQEVFGEKKAALPRR